ncbi:MAG: helix-turn-helix domain-containing protein [Actinomycetota bacterium]|nr:helix-turn-helix domain-containing protein [Actinomycetota bacterium]
MAFSPRAEGLVDAARRLANESGTAAFTVAQVAERAGASLKAFYGCFRGKDELLLALIEDDSGLGAALLEARIAAYDHPLEGFVDELFALLREPGAAGYAGVLVREHRRLGELHPEGLDTALAPITSLLASLIPSADPKRDAQTMLGVLITGIHDILLGRVDDPTELASYLYGFCTRGLDLT